MVNHIANILITNASGSSQRFLLRRREMAPHESLESPGTHLEELVSACQELISRRFPDSEEHGAAAVLLEDGRILTGTSPDFIHPGTTVCHEMEPFCAAFRLNQRIVASVCLHRGQNQNFLVLSPCGICRERLTMYGPDVKVAVPGPDKSTDIQWITLREALPHYWVSVFPEEIPEWSE